MDDVLRRLSEAADYLDSIDQKWFARDVRAGMDAIQVMRGEAPPITDAATRDLYGRIVRDAWIGWARQQPTPKPSWLVPYEGLSEPDKEADRQIAEAVLATLFDPPDWVKRSSTKTT